jgi:hypothetical protein
VSLDVQQRGRRVATFRFVSVRLMETAAAWTPTTPEMEVKVLLGRHIWDFAQQADALGRRTFELRLPLQHSLAPAEGVQRVLEALRALSGTTERLAGLYDLVLPDLERRYREHVADVDPVLDAPTVVIVERTLVELARQRAEADALRRELALPSASLPELARAVAGAGPLVAEEAALRG